MSLYLRPRIPGASVFFTVALADRASDLLVREVAALRAAVRQARSERPFGIDAWVVLPDHLHCVWTLPEGDADYSVRWGAVKGRFTNALRRSGLAPILPPRNGYGAQAGRWRRGGPYAEGVGVNPDLNVLLVFRGLMEHPVHLEASKISQKTPDAAATRLVLQGPCKQQKELK